ncbi:MAG: hypothetical protein IPM26_13560 [Saprospiraceae bacterium]|nr:hypothetical protein [Saprospiraceae bacterium]
MALPFNEFEQVTREKWLAKVESDLKGQKSVGDLDYTFGTDLRLSPFLMEAEVRPEIPLAFSPCLKGADIRTASDLAANTFALKLLQAGLDVLRFSVYEHTRLGQLLQEIDPQYVKLVLDAASCSPEKIQQMASEIRNMYQKYAEQCTIEQNLIDTELSDHIFRYAIQYKPDKELISSLKNLCAEIRELLHKHPAAGITVCLYIDSKIPANISILRSIRILIKKLEVEDRCVLAVMPDAEFLAEDPNIRMIQMSYASFIAMCGGADILYGVPVQSESEVETARLCVNAMHIFREESRLDKVSDPFAGSYFIEAATTAIVEEVLN